MVDKVWPASSHSPRSKDVGQLGDEPCTVIIQKLEAEGLADDPLVHAKGLMTGPLDIVQVRQLELVLILDL